MHSSFKKPAFILLEGLMLTALAGGPIVAQTQHAPLDGNSLRRRAPKVTESIQSVYDTAEFKEAYSSARELYKNTKPAAEWTPVPFNAKKPSVWLMPTQRALEKFANDVNVLEDQLSAREKDAQIQKNPQQLGQIVALENNFTKDCLESLNRLVVNLSLGSFFVKNNMARQAANWYPVHVPFRNTQMSLVGDYVMRVDDELGFTPNASIWKEPAIDRNGNPVQSSSEILNDTVGELYEHLARARSTIDQEGLLNPNGNLRETASIPKSPTVARISVH